MKATNLFVSLHFWALYLQSQYLNPIEEGKKRTFVFDYESFNSNIRDSNSPGLWFLMLYSPKCKYCEELFPVFYNSAYDHRKTEVKFGQVNCLDFPDICVLLRIKYYPFLMFVKERQIAEFLGEKNLSGLNLFVELGWKQA